MFLRFFLAFHVISYIKYLCFISDPKLVAFLKNRSSKSSNSLLPTNKTLGANECEIKENKDEAKEIKDYKIEFRDNAKETSEKYDVTEKPIDPYLEFDIKKNYINMSDIEREKLEWMKNIPKIQLQEVNYLIYTF